MSLCYASASPARTELSCMLKGVQLRSAAAFARGRRLTASLTALRLSAERAKNPEPLLRDRQVVALALASVLRRVRVEALAAVLRRVRVETILPARHPYSFSSLD